MASVCQKSCQHLEKRITPSQDTKAWIITIKFISNCITGTHATIGKINEFDSEFLSILRRTISPLRDMTILFVYSWKMAKIVQSASGGTKAYLEYKIIYWKYKVYNSFKWFDVTLNWKSLRVSRENEENNLTLCFTGTQVNFILLLCM